MRDLIWIEVNKKNIKHNIKTIRKIIGKNTIMAPAVKANAYGHGLIGYSKLILKYGADWLCVNSVWEAEQLRLAGIRKPILVIGYTQIANLYKIIDLRLKTIIYNIESAKKLSHLAKKARIKVPVHIKVDTGMSRQGVLVSNLVKFINDIKKWPNLYIEGIATHYATADELEKSSYFQKQFKAFKQVEGIAKQFRIKLLHSSNSAATLVHPDTHWQLARPGKSIYGHYPSEEVAKWCKKRKIMLKPTLSLKTKVAQVKEISKGTGVSYGVTFVARKKTMIAVLPIGYYDGLDRKLSNKGEVLIRGKRAKILGRVCMNMFVIDVSHIPNVKAEDEVVVIGKQGKERITVEEIAAKAGTINYEITTRLRESIERCYV